MRYITFYNESEKTQNYLSSPNDIISKNIIFLSVKN